MAHIGRPGPWAIFRDMVGPLDWAINGQPQLWQRLKRLAGGGTYTLAIAQDVISNTEIEWNQNDTFWSYTWDQPAVTPFPAFHVTIKFDYVESGTKLRAEVALSGGGVTASAVGILQHVGGYEEINGTSGAVFDVQPGATTSDPVKWNWNYLGVTDTFRLALDFVDWADVPP